MDTPPLVKMRSEALPRHGEARDADFRMLSGRVVNLLDPSPVDIDLCDYVVGCSRIGRWAGQTRGEIGYNVLHHQIVTLDVMIEIVLALDPGPARLRQLKLKRVKTHDLHEAAGIGDIVTPVGRCLDFNTNRIDEFKFRHDRAIGLAAGIPAAATAADEADIAAAVKLADRIAAVSEAVQLMGCDEEFARRRYGRGWRGPLLARRIEPMDEIQSRRVYYARAAEIGLRIGPGAAGAAA